VIPVELNDPRFTAWASGRFMERWGPLGKDASGSSQKLCLVATDAAFLIDLLYGLSLRADCIYVKYGTFAHEGMYLGRCFLQSAAATAELCQQLKSHARLMVSVQDDDFFNPYREPRPPAGTCEVWDDWAEDAKTVDEVHRQAFGREDEAAMVRAVREQRAATVSLVAAVQSEGSGHVESRIVGHVLLTRVTTDHRDEPRGVGLAPVAVLPDYQRRGFGARLIEVALRRARLLGYRYAVVLGHPSYYPRFGFVPASRFGLRYEQRVPDEAFMALELTPGGLAGAEGVVRYLSAFGHPK
jgi:putative acetyltransferase